MDLSTRYLGFELPHPFMPGSSPLADDLDAVRRLEDGGAAAIVLRSLFVEQVARERPGDCIHLDTHGPSFAEAAANFPPQWAFVMGPAEYLEHLRRVKGAVRLPVIASINAGLPGQWLEHASAMQDAGADALELNLYFLAADTELTASEVEARLIEIVREVRRTVRVPLAVKLPAQFTAFANLAKRLVEAGADGLVLFNRFLQPDIDPVTRRLVANPQLSRPSELLLRLRWLAILSGRLKCSLAASGGVQDGMDAVKAVMAGADVVQMVSALLARKPEHLRTAREEMARFLEDNGYESLAAMRARLSLSSCPDPAVHERAHYMMALQGWSQA